MAKIAELFVEIGAKIDKFEKGMSDVQKGMVNTGKKFDKIGKSLTRNVTLPILAVGAASIKAFADFDKAMTESLAIMGNVSDSMKKKMAGMARTMSEETTFSAKELAEAYFFMASAGMDAAQSVAALGDVARFAQAGAFDLATATDLLTDAQTALGLSSKDAIENQKNLVALSDVLVKANTLANASVLQFSEALTNFAAAALINVNKEMEEGVAVLAAFADKGIKGQVAGMRFSMMLTNLETAAQGNEEAFKKFNVAVYDGTGNMRNIADIIGDLENALDGLPAKQKAAAMAQMGFNDRARKSITTLMGSSEKIRQWEKDLKNAAGTTKKVSDKQMKAFANQMKLVWNTVVNLAASIGEQLGPALLDIVKAMKPLLKFAASLVEKFSKLPGFVKTMAMAFVGLLAALGPALMIFGKFLIILPKLKVMFVALKAAALGMSGPFGIVVIAALALGKALNVLINKYKAKQDAEMEAIVKSGTVVNKAMTLRKKLIENEILTVEQWSEIFNKHGRNHGRVLNAIANNPAYEKIREKLEAIKDETEDLTGVTGLLGKAQAALLKPIKAQKIVLAAVNDALKKSTELTDEQKTALEAAKTALEANIGATEGLSSASDTLIKKLEFTVSPSLALARSFAAGKISSLEYADGMRKLREEAEKLADPFKNLELATESAGEAYLYMADDMEGAMGSVMESVGLWNADSQKAYDENAEAAEQAAIAAQEAWEYTYRHLITLAENMGGAFGGFAEGIMDESSTLKENLQGLWDDILGSFRSMIGDMVQEWATNFLKQTLLDLTTKTAKEAGESITSNLGGAVSDAGKAAVSLAKGIGGAIVSLAQAIVSAAKIIASGAGALLKAAAVLLAIYGAFKIINKLFGKTGGGGAADYTNKILLTMRDHIGAQSEKMDETNRLLAGFYGKYDTMLAELYKIRDATQGTLTALTSQGTVYVDVFRSAVFEGVGEKLTTGLSGLTETLSGDAEKIKAEYAKKGEQIKQELAKLQDITAKKLETLQQALVTATDEEKIAIQQKIQQTAAEAQIKRAELISQLQALEVAQKNALESVSGNIVDAVSGVKDSIEGGLSDVAGRIGDISFDTDGIVNAVNGVRDKFGGGVNAAVPEFQTGGFVPRDTFARLHAGETVIPKGGGAGPTVILNISTMDAIGVRDFMRKRGIPEIIAAIKKGGNTKTLMKEALNLS